MRSTAILGLVMSCGIATSVAAQREADEPVAFWTIDLGDAWVPPILAEPNEFAPTFRALALEQWPDDALGNRAEQDRYLDNYGIPPALSVLRGRMEALVEAPCVDALDLEGIALFAGLDVDEDEPRAPVMASDEALEARITELFVRHDASSIDELRTKASSRELRDLDRWVTESRWRRGLDAVRERLRCSGDLETPIPTRPDLDARTRRALELFERRHRIRSRGNLSGHTLRALRIDPRELARRDLVRVLVERVRLDRGILADGTGDAPDLDDALAHHLGTELGLDTFESALAFLRPLQLTGHLEQDIVPIELPAYQRVEDLDIEIVIDRGDVWFDPPFRPDGSRRVLPVERRPTLTLYAVHEGERIVVVRWPTTIGGWHQELVGGELEWRYKESPAGEFAWERVIAAPVWLPPPSTPADDLVTQRRVDEHGNVEAEVRATLLGPGYASAYGLVVANHRRATRLANGRLRLGGDDGIRTHGSVDYTSVWRRASHGCHRLENHRALALFSFVLKHRPHTAEGHARVRYSRIVRTSERTLSLRIDRGGFGFALERPVPVRVLPGRILGEQRTPPREGIAIPR